MAVSWPWAGLGTAQPLPAQLLQPCPHGRQGQLAGRLHPSPPLGGNAYGGMTACATGEERGQRWAECSTARRKRGFGTFAVYACAAHARAAQVVMQRGQRPISSRQGVAAAALARGPVALIVAGCGAGGHETPVQKTGVPVCGCGVHDMVTPAVLGCV